MADVWLLAVPRSLFQNSWTFAAERKPEFVSYHILSVPLARPHRLRLPPSFKSVASTMVSPLWKASSEGNLENLTELLKDATPVDIEVKGACQPRIYLWFLRASSLLRRSTS